MIGLEREWEPHSSCIVSTWTILSLHFDRESIEQRNARARLWTYVCQAEIVCNIGPHPFYGVICVSASPSEHIIDNYRKESIPYDTDGKQNSRRAKPFQLSIRSSGIGCQLRPLAGLKVELFVIHSGNSEPSWASPLSSARVCRIESKPQMAWLPISVPIVR